MSQNPRINSDTQLSKTPTLKPVLASALASLEVQLDQELARYRRTRNTSRLANSPRVISYVGSSPQAIAAAILEQSQAAETKPSIAPSVTSETPAMEAVAELADLDEMDHLLLSSTPEDTQIPTPPPAPPPVNTATSIIPTGQSHQDSNGLKADENPIEPEDYLESSEALLRSVTDEDPQKKKSSSANDGLLSPLGIGSMLLLLVASLTLGYVIFNPKGLSHFNISKLFSSQSSTPTEKTTVPVGNTPTQPEPVLTPIPKYPNLATKEFPEVNDPNDIVGLQPKGQETPRPVPNPVPIQPVNPPIQPPTQVSPPQAVNPLTVAPSPQVQPVTPVTPSTPTNSQTLPNPQLKPSADGFYHVVIDNNSDGTFASVRRVVPDAYLSTDNKFIFLGAFKTQKEVQKHLQLLEKNGIQARVQQP